MVHGQRVCGHVPSQGGQNKTDSSASATDTTCTTVCSLQRGWLLPASSSRCDPTQSLLWPADPLQRLEQLTKVLKLTNSAALQTVKRLYAVEGLDYSSRGFDWWSLPPYIVAMLLAATAAGLSHSSCKHSLAAMCVYHRNSLHVEEDAWWSSCNTHCKLLYRSFEDQAMVLCVAQCWPW